MTNEQKEKVETLARRIRLQAMLCQDTNLSEFDDEDLRELMTMQIERAYEIEHILGKKSNALELVSNG